MKKLFVSLPMMGLNREEIRERQWEAVEAARKLFPEEDAIILVDSFVEDIPEGVNGSLWCLGESLKRMARADIAYFCRGGERARGCRIERRCAKDYGVGYVTETENGWVFYKINE